MKRKLKLIIWVSLAGFFLAGFGKKSIELLNDAKLLDLDKAIELARPGANSPEDKDPTEEKNTENENSGESTVSPGTEEPRTIVISIRDEKIRYDAQECRNVLRLEQKVRADCQDNVCFSLVDDFAEAHVYRDALKMLRKLHAELGVEYTTE